MRADGHIFISYSRRDGREHAERLESALRTRGLATWRDTRDIDPAQDFTAEIENGIEAASHVVVCVTPDSKRGDSFVRREIQYALLSKKPVIPLRFADIPPHIQVVNNEWIDLYREWDAPFERLCAILDSAADEFRKSKASEDPYREYLKALYERIVSYLNQTVFSLITLSSEATPNAVEEVSAQALPMAFFAMAGIEDKVDKARQFHSFQEAFEQYGGRVLLLGEPGAGKTTTLFAFARDAVAARLENPVLPLPILASIATWDSIKQTELADWLAGEIPALQVDEISDAISTGNALLMLDGLDELGSEREDPKTKSHYDPRQRFLKIIPGKIHVVVTCRVKDYGEIGEKIRLKGAVTLQPLDDEQLYQYLRKMPNLWAALEVDDGLREVSRTPLLLGLFTYAFAGLDEEAKKLRDLSRGDVRDKIFETYVRRRYEHEERKLRLRNEGVWCTLEEIYRMLGRVAMENAADWFKTENRLTIAYFSSRMHSNRAQDFVDLMVKLHFLVRSSEAVFHFIHLLMRDYFAFDCALSSLRHSSAYVRREAISSLFAVGGNRAVEPLIAALHDTDARVRQDAVAVLSRIGDTRSIDPLIAILSDSDVEVCREAVVALSMLGDIRSVPAFIGLLSDTRITLFRFRVCDVAALALQRFGTPEALEAVARWRREQGAAE